MDSLRALMCDFAFCLVYLSNGFTDCERLLKIDVGNSSFAEWNGVLETGDFRVGVFTKDGSNAGVNYCCCLDYGVAIGDLAVGD